MRAFRVSRGLSGAEGDPAALREKPAYSIRWGMPTEGPPGASLARLVEIMDRLLAPGGCPWDREQTLETLRPYLVEETYEVLDAMTRKDVHGHCEELGDLLMQIVFHA